MISQLNTSSGRKAVLLCIPYNNPSHILRLPLRYSSSSSTTGVNCLVFRLPEEFAEQHQLREEVGLPSVG